MTTLEKEFSDILSSVSEDCIAEIAQAFLNHEEKDIALEILKEYGTETYFADDGNCEVEYDYADSPEKAAKEYVSDGDWGDSNETTWVTVYVTTGYVLGDVVMKDEESHESFNIPIDPDEPDCEEGEHEWVSPWEVVGGCESNPGVLGNGGGVIIHEVCEHCGCLRTTDTWAQNPENGKQGLTSVSYNDGDHEYRDAWEEWCAKAIVKALSDGGFYDAQVSGSDVKIIVRSGPDGEAWATLKEIRVAVESFGWSAEWGEMCEDSDGDGVEKTEIRIYKK